MVIFPSNPNSDPLVHIHICEPGKQSTQSDLFEVHQQSPQYESRKKELKLLQSRQKELKMFTEKELKLLRK